MATSFADITGTIEASQIPNPFPVTSISASNDIASATMETGTLNVSGIATVNTLNTAADVNVGGQANAGSFGTNGQIWVGGTSICEGNTQTATLTGAGAPSVAAGAANVIGTGASVAVYGSSLAGEIDLTTGSGPRDGGTVVTITFPKAFPYAPKALVVQNGYNGAWSWDTTTTTLTIYTPGYLAANTFYKLNYIVIG